MDIYSNADYGTYYLYPGATVARIRGYDVDGIPDNVGVDGPEVDSPIMDYDADGSTYDKSLPGDISEVGKIDWTGLITGYLATNPLVLLATGSSISLFSEE